MGETSASMAETAQTEIDAFVVADNGDDEFEPAVANLKQDLWHISQAKKTGGLDDDPMPKYDHSEYTDKLDSDDLMF